MEKDKHKKDEALNFKAVNPGLGFHPFSDGLPYAPISKAPGTNKTMTTEPARAPVSTQRSFTGTGAVAAGPARFNPPPRPGQPPTPRINVPVARPKAPSVDPLLAISQKAAVPASVPISVANPAKLNSLSGITASDMAAAALALELEPRYGLGYTFKRILALLIDSAFNIALCLGGLIFVLSKQKLNWELLFNPGTALITVLFLLVFNWALVTAQEIAFGTSVGKRLFGLVLRGSTSAIFLRAFFFLPSLGFCAFGVVWGLFDRRHRCWHDLVVDLQPTELAEL